MQSAGTTPTYTGVANGNPKMNNVSMVQNPATLTVEETTNTTFAGTIANAITDHYDSSSSSYYVPGAISIVKAGSAMLTLSGVNSYSGQTTVNGGILNVASVGAIPTASPVTVNNGGTLLAGVTNCFGNGTGSLPAITLNSGGVLDSISGTTVNLGSLNLNGGTLAGTPTPQAVYYDWTLNQTVTVGQAALDHQRPRRNQPPRLRDVQCRRQPIMLLRRT